MHVREPSKERGSALGMVTLSVRFFLLFAVVLLQDGSTRSLPSPAARGGRRC